MEDKQKKILGWVFLGLTVIGLVLVIVGMFLGYAHSDNLKVTYKLTDDKAWSLAEAMAKMTDGKITPYIVSSTFVMISFIATIVGATLLCLYAALKSFLHKNIKPLGVIALIVTILGSVLILGAGLVLAHNLDALYNFKAQVKVKYFSASSGIYLGFAGGIVAAISGVLSRLKVFACE